MRLLLSAVASLLLFALTACDNEPQIDFAQPFPLSAPVGSSLAIQHQGLYRAASDSTYRLIIGPSAIWADYLFTGLGGVRQLDSLKIPGAGRKMNVWQVALDGTNYRLRPSQSDSVWLDFWASDTLGTLRPTSAHQVRWFRGAYYLSQRSRSERVYWQVKRLVLNGRQLSFQALGTDTLRIAALPASVVRRDTAGGYPYWLLRPATRRQERQLVAYAGLWRTERELLRQ